MGEHLVDEETTVEALALEPPVHVREREQNGVDLARVDRGAQRVDRQQPASLHAGTVEQLDYVVGWTDASIAFVTSSGGGVASTGTRIPRPR